MKRLAFLLALLLPSLAWGDTTTINYDSGTGIEDNFVDLVSSGDNYGGWSQVSIGNTSGYRRRRGLVRYDESLIPSGSITRHEYFWYRISSASSTQSGTLEFFKIKAANPWAEGASVGTAQTGESAWAWYSKSTAWAGSGGCSTSGTDFVADASPPSFSYSAYASGDLDTSVKSQSLITTWAEDWRDAGDNEGFLIAQGSDVLYNFYAYASTDYGSYEPYIEIETGSATAYTTPIMMFE